MASLKEITGLVTTGDIVLFSGRGFISRLLQFCQWSRWSHVGMVVRLPQFHHPLLWEATSLDFKGDVLLDKPVKGVRLVELGGAISSCSGRVTIRHLHGINFNDMQHLALADLQQKLSGLPYERSKRQLFKAWFDWFGRRNTEDLTSVFCSELVAEAYQTLGLLDETKPSNEYVPADFSEKRGLMVKGGYLGPEIKVDSA